MAEMHDTRQLGAPGQRTSLSTMTNLLGAAASLALLIGIVVWGYQLFMRDVSGVPVVKAAEGPMRVQPEDPGGQLARNQGLSVNDVAAVGGAGDPADRLVLAPAPLDLTAEDATMPSVGQAIVPAQPAPQEASADEADVQPAPNPESLQLAAVEALAEQLSEGVAPLGEVAPATEAAPESDELEAAVAAAMGENVEIAELASDVDVDGEGGLGRSLRPKLRPATLTNVQPTAAVTSASLDVDPATIPVGTRLAQLGAFDSADVAQAEWTKLQGRFGEYLGGKNRVIQKATSGGRTFYRLRAMGFEDLSDARRFCSALVSEGADCIPVVTR